MTYFNRDEYEMEDHLREQRRATTCARCGKTDLKWRTNAAGEWRLYEDARVEHNRLKEHSCTSLDDFEVCQ